MRYASRSAPTRKSTPCSRHSPHSLGLDPPTRGGGLGRLRWPRGPGSPATAGSKSTARLRDPRRPPRPPPPPRDVHHQVERALVVTVLALVAFVVRRCRREGRRARAGGRRCRALDEIGPMLVEPREHVVARLVHRLTSVADRVVLGVLLGGEHGAERLAVLVPYGNAEIRSVESEARQVPGGLGSDVRAAQVAEVI